MARRRCQYCRRPLSRWAKVLHVYTCKGCVYRMSMGTSPARPREQPTAMAQAVAAMDGLPDSLSSAPVERVGGSPASPAVEHPPESRNTADSSLRPGT